MFLTHAARMYKGHPLHPRQQSSSSESSQCCLSDGHFIELQCGGMIAGGVGGVIGLVGVGGVGADLVFLPMHAALVSHSCAALRRSTTIRGGTPNQKLFRVDDPGTSPSDDRIYDMRRNTSTTSRPLTPLVNSSSASHTPCLYGTSTQVQLQVRQSNLGDLSRLPACIACKGSATNRQDNGLATGPSATCKLQIYSSPYGRRSWSATIASYRSAS